MKKYIALVVVFIFVLSLVGCSSDEPKRNLTIDELKVIAEKGDNISWSDFDPFIYSYEGGSGIYFRTYPVGDKYVLHVEGGLPDWILSVRLSTKVIVGGSLDVYREIDIRTENIDEFLREVNESNISPVPLEEISDEDFFWIVDNLGYNIYNSLYQLNGEKYGRVIASSKSSEDAVKVCTRHFTDKRYPTHINTVVDCKVIYESDILYGIYVKWEVQGHYYDENVISFKKDIADITVWNVIYGDEESYKISTKAEDQIKQILLYLFHNKYLSSYVIDYEMLSDDNEYAIILYSYYTVVGDWDLPDEYNLQKHTVVIDKTSGKVTFGEAVPIKTAHRFDN